MIYEMQSEINPLNNSEFYFNNITLLYLLNLSQILLQIYIYLYKSYCLAHIKKVAFEYIQLSNKKFLYIYI